MQKKLILNPILLVSIIFVLIFSTTKVHAQVIFVDSASAALTPDGSSWANAYPTFQAGVNAATLGDTVYVAEGTYQPAVNSSFAMKAGVKIFGGFTDTDSTATFSLRNWQAYPTILAGDSTTVVANSNVDSTSVLDGFTIRSGNGVLGGGMSNSSSSPKLSNIVFTLNTAVIGGGMYNSFLSDPILTDVVFYNNTAVGYGGGMFNDEATPTLTDVIFSNNVVGSDGGAVYNATSSPIITNVSFSNNKATRGDGGAISNNYSSIPVLTNVVFWGNSAIVLPGADIFNDPLSSTNATYCFTQSPTLGTNNILGNIDPFTNDNIPAGADGIFMTADDGLQLTGCSAAVNSGNNAATTITTDIAGEPRIFDTIIDMGAYEYQSTKEPVGVNLAINDDASIQTISPGVNNFIANGACRLIDQVVPGTVSGSVSSTVWIDPSVQSYQGQPYVQRHYDITPDTGAVMATATVTLYFTQDEFDAYNAVSTVRLPESPNDSVGIANLIVKQFHGISATGVPGTYSGATVIIDPGDSNIVWNSTLNRWEITFSINGFSGFIVTTQGEVLPISLLSFTGQLANGKTNLQWKTTDEQNVDHFEVDRSSDGKTFSYFTTVKAVGSGNNSYTTVDAQPLIGYNYYRLKSIDKDGAYSYSNIVLVNNDVDANFIIYPNPTSKQLTVEYDDVTNAVINIYSLDGQKVLSVPTDQVKTTIDVSNFATGTYMIEYSSDTQTFRDKFIKVN